jgi:hypothetical protein
MVDCGIVRNGRNTEGGSLLMTETQRATILGLLGVGFLVLTPPAICGQQTTPCPKSVEAIPLAKCTVRESLNVSYLQSSSRGAASAKQALTADEKMSRLMGSLPKANVPVAKLMNSDQAAAFEQLRVQMIMQNLNQLAESRLQRDYVAMLDAADAIGAMERGARKVTSKDDPKGEGAGLLGLLRKVLEEDQNAPLTNPNPNVCGIDLALYHQELLAMGRLQKLAQSQEAKMLIALRKKHGIAGPLDPQKLPSPDREEAVWLMKAVGLPIQRELLALEDWQNLRWYEKASQLEYDSLRNDIINGGGSLKYDYTTTIFLFHTSREGDRVLTR